MRDMNYDLPTPQMLIKKAKEETVPVSLRVKESTLAIFDRMAKEAGVNRGIMMNLLLDFYAESQKTSDEENAKYILMSYVYSERYWKSTASLAVEEMIERICSLQDEGFFLNGENDSSMLCRAFDSNEDTYYDDLLIFIDDLYAIGASNRHTEYIGREDEEDKYLYLYLSKELWPLVVVLLGEYRKKYKTLFPDQKYTISSEVLKQIAHACESCEEPNLTLACYIRDILGKHVESLNG